MSERPAATVYSMTGYGQAERSDERHRIGVAIRTVNHRFLDLALRLSDQYRFLENPLRERVAARLRRGRVEATIEIEFLGEREVRVEVDRVVATALEGERRRLEEAGVELQPLSFSDLVRLPDVVRVDCDQEQWLASDQQLFETVVDEALGQVLDGRRREGEKLRAALELRLGTLSSLIDTLGERRREVEAETLEALRDRLARLLSDASVPEERLTQEAAVLVERSDIGEELDRLGSHLTHFRENLKRGGTVGKRSEFLSQEIYRELNTVVAKCRDAQMTATAVDAKLLCEQLREQVQNLE